MRREIAGLITAGLIICAAAPAAAQSSRPSSTKPSIGLFGIFDVSSIAATQSFDAVFGEHTTMGPGVGVEVTNLWKGFFIRIAGTQSKLSGERVVGEERLLADRGRFRDVRVGPDGALYALTDEDNGELLRLAPEAGAATRTGSLAP